VPLCRCALEISSRCFGFLQSLGQAGTSLELLGGLSFIFFEGGRVEAVSFTSGSFQNSNSCRSLDRVRLSPVPQCASATNARTVWDPSKYHSGVLTLLLTFGDRITQKLC